MLEGVGDPWDFVLARVAINYPPRADPGRRHRRRRLRVDRVGNSSVTLREEIRTLGGELAADAEAVIVARDPASGRSRALTEAERDVFERARALI